MAPLPDTLHESIAGFAKAPVNNYSLTTLTGTAAFSSAVGSGYLLMSGTGAGQLHVQSASANVGGELMVRLTSPHAHTITFVASELAIKTTGGVNAISGTTYTFPPNIGDMAKFSCDGRRWWCVLNSTGSIS